MFEQMLQVIKILLDKADRTFVFFSSWKGIVGVVGVIVLVYLLRRVWLKLRGSTGDIESVVKYLISNSARHIHSAVELSKKDIVEAYEHAVYGLVMASTAKDLVDDKTSFSSDLSVDVYAYLDYANKVVSQIKQRLVALH